MRVLHFIPDIGISNGVMSVILNYASAMLDDIKFDVVYFQKTGQTKKAQIESLGGEVFCVNSPLSKKSFILSFAKLLKDHKGRWQAMHIHVPYYSCLIVPLARKYGIKKVCCHCHTNSFSLIGKLGWLFKIMNLPTNVIVKKRFACSRAAGAVWYGKKARYEVINNAIFCERYRFDAQRREEVRKKLNCDNLTVIGHVGTGKLEQKNHEFLFKVFREFLNTNSNSLLLLIGAEKDERLLSMCKNLGIQDKVVFLGLRNDVPDLLQAIDVFVFPSIKEGLPVAVIEAQASGLPILMSDTVTDECIVTDLVHTLSLNESPKKWAELCRDLSDRKRKDTCTKMEAVGWNIHNEAKKLADYYLK